MEREHLSTSSLFVHFDGGIVKKQAQILCHDSEYMVLAAPEEERINNQPNNIPLPLPKPATFEQCCTIATMSGTKLHAKCKDPLP